MKKLYVLNLLAALIICMSVNIQYSVAAVNNSIPQKNVVTAVANTTIELSETDMWWGYFDGVYSDVPRQCGVGKSTKAPITYNCCIKIPAGMKIDRDRNIIKGIKFAFNDLTYIDDVKIWISHEKPATADEADVCVKTLEKSSLKSYVSEGKACANEVAFNEPYQFDTVKDIYVGYSFTVLENDGTLNTQKPVITAEEPKTTSKNALFMKYGKNWIDMVNSNLGNLAMQVLLDGEFNEDIAKVQSSFMQVGGVANEDVKFRLRIENEGTADICSLSYKYEIDGEMFDEQTTSLENPIVGLGSSALVHFCVKCPAKTGYHNLKIYVTGVNGSKNTSENLMSEGSMLAVSESVTNKAVLEEYTATNCGWCPRGMVGLDKAVEMFGEKVIPIAIHRWDIMYCADYENEMSKLKGIPALNINRQYIDIDPYFGTYKPEDKFFGLGDNLNDILNNTPAAEVNVEATLLEDGKTVDIRSDVRFLYDDDADTYAMAYVITEDGLTNKGDKDYYWDQKNSFAGEKESGEYDFDPAFDEWVNGDKYRRGIIFNHVSVGAEGIDKGIDGSVTVPVRVNEVNTHNIVLDLDEIQAKKKVVNEEKGDYIFNVLVQDKEKLNICAILINTRTGYIVNADFKRVKYTQSGIEELSTEDVNNNVIGIYTVEGKKVDAMVKGINIVKYADGKTDKIYNY